MGTKIRRSSAVVLTRGEGQSLEVYLAERSKSLRFYGGYWAFPGGVLDLGLDGSQVEFGQPGHAEGQARCAHRELFEEAGVLLGPTSHLVGALERAELRRDLIGLQAGEIEARWQSACSQAGFHPEQLPSFARMVTPAFSGRRYDTTFHHALLEGEEHPVVDGEELTAGAFFSPGELLNRWRRGELYVVPPAVSLLEHFVRFGLHGGLLSAHRSCSAVMAGQLSGACLSPGILVAPLKTPTVPPATTTNTFLVGSQKVYVIDPATPDEGERRRLFDLCDRVESEGSSIAGVLLTHHHWDHVGSAAAVAERYSVAVGAHPESLARLDLGAAELREVNEGDEFDLGTAPNGDPDWTLRAIFTPGHAPGHLAFIESSLRGAIVGDLVSTLSSIVIDPPEGHMETYLASLRRLIDEDIRVLHPAHGLPTRDGVEVVRGYLEHRAERERKLLGALGPEPLLPSDLVATLYCDTPAAMHGYAERSLLAGLIKLREQGQARETANGWLRQR